LLLISLAFATYCYLIIHNWYSWFRNLSKAR
jgi:hypothetical protein